jgi:hypothetical protein
MNMNRKIINNIIIIQKSMSDANRLTTTSESSLRASSSSSSDYSEGARDDSDRPFSRTIETDEQMKDSFIPRNDSLFGSNSSMKMEHFEDSAFDNIGSVIDHGDSINDSHFKKSHYYGEKTEIIGKLVRL